MAIDMIRALRLSITWHAHYRGVPRRLSLAIYKDNGSDTPFTVRLWPLQ